MASKPNRSIHLVNSVTGVAALRSEWLKLRSSPDDPDMYLTILYSRPEILRPHLIVLNTDGSPQSILVGRLEHRRLSLGFGYIRTALPQVRCLTFMGGRPLGDQSEQSATELVNSVQESLRHKDADIAFFEHLPVGSNLHDAVRKVGGVFCRDHFPVVHDHWKLVLPPSYAELIRQRSANTRRNFKRYSQRLLGAFQGQIVVRVFRYPDEIELVLEHTEAVAGKTYHRGLKVGFMANNETRQRMIHYAKQGRFRAYILYIGEAPIAFWNGFFFQRTFFTWTTGYDTAYREFRPGQFLLQRLFENLCNEGSADEVDFGLGDAQYKRDWCGHNCKETSLYLFAPNLRGALINSVRTPLIACSSLARWCLTKTSLLHRTKRLWRSYLSGKSTIKSVNEANL